MKKALISVNNIGFIHFLWDDIDILSERGYKVYVTADNREKEDHTVKMLEEHNATFIEIKIDGRSPVTITNIKSYFAYKKLFKKAQFEIIQCPTTITGLIVRMAAKSLRKHGAKVFYTTHGLAYTHLSGRKAYFVYHFVESFASHLCDAIITINKEDYENAKKLHCPKVFHINGVGVDVQKYQNVNVDRGDYRNKLGIPDDKIMILSIGELSHRKNHSVIIRALGMLKDKDKYVFAICGRALGKGGGTYDLLKELSEEHNVDLKLLGFRHDIPQVIKCADIGAIPSIREGLGLAGIETLSEGVPLVGSDVQGIREYIIDGVTGYLCDPYDVEAFSVSIQKLSNPQGRGKMENACKEIAAKFDKKISVEQRKNIYNELIGG